MQDKSDLILIDESLRGDDNSFKELLSRYLKLIYTITYQITGSEEESKDITQDTFVKVWKNLKKYNGKSSFKTWLISVARNTTIDFLRKKQSILFSNLDKDDDADNFKDSLIDNQPLQDELFEIEENKTKVEKALLKISIEKRTIIILHIYEDLTFEEISKILNKSINTVKSQYRRALLELKEYLA
jgi:RNA polymerase sigma-70 factor (ECF subfamily)